MTDRSNECTVDFDGYILVKSESMTVAGIEGMVDFNGHMLNQK